MKRLLSIIMALALALTMCFSQSVVYGAEKTTDNDFVALKVFYKDKLVKEMTLYDLEELEEAEGSVIRSYSGYNRNVTYKGKDLKNLHGPTIQGILAEAGIDVTALKSTDIIEINGYDQYGYKFQIGQLFKTRYYYPKAADEDYQIGAPVKPETMEGAVEVPAILALDCREEEDEDKRVDRLVFGQEYPNEQNYTLFTKYMIDYKYRNLNGTRISEIRVKPAKATKWSNVTKPTYTNKAKVPIGSQINFKTKYKPPQDVAWIVYTTDGSTPDVSSSKYNYSRWGDNRPVEINKLGKITVKVKTIGMGKSDSSVMTLNYTVIVGKPANFSAKSTNYDEVTLSWDSNKYITGYEVYQLVGKKYQLIDTVIPETGEALPDKHEYTVKALKTGTACKFKVRAFVTEGEKTTYSAYTAIKSVTPAVLAPEIEDIYQEEEGDGTAMLQWSVIEGADGYEVQRSLYKSKKFAKVLTTEGNEEIFASNTGLKAGKTYYYKVRAYRLVDGKKKYGSYSIVNSIKIN